MLYKLVFKKKKKMEMWEVLNKTEKEKMGEEEIGWWQ